MKHLQLSDSKFEPREGYERSVLFDSADFEGNTKLQLMRLAPVKASNLITMRCALNASE